SSVDEHLAVTDHTDSARVLELAERSTAVTVGLLNAATEAHDFVNRGNEPTTRALAELLADVPGIEVIAPGERHSGIVTFRHDTVPAPRITETLRESGINVWNVVGWHTPQYLLGRGVPEAVRASVHWYTTSADLDSLVTQLRRITA
ncbi:MAG: aminotransferase class V-fold PLP-dependent enzyme, partial [Stackebrandtia sp.]